MYINQKKQKNMSLVAYAVDDCYIVVELTTKCTFLIPLFTMKSWQKNLFQILPNQSIVKFEQFLKENDIKEGDYPNTWHDKHSGTEYQVHDIKSLMCAVMELWIENGYDVEEKCFFSVGKPRGLFVISL